MCNCFLPIPAIFSWLPSTLYIGRTISIWKTKERQTKKKTRHMTSAHTINLLQWNPQTHNRWQNTQTSIQPMSALQEVPGVCNVPHPELLKTKSFNLAGPGRHLSPLLSTHLTAAELICVRIEYKEVRCFCETVPNYSATKSRLWNSGLCMEFSEVSAHSSVCCPQISILKKVSCNIDQIVVFSLMMENHKLKLKLLFST